MKANRKIRKEAWKLSHGKWFWRIFSGGLVLYFITIVVSGLMSMSFREMNIQTWSDFIEVKIRNLQGGLGYTVPSSAIALQMTGASLFQQFIACILGSIVMFGIACMLLKAVRDSDERWMADSLSGFKRPFELAWLMVLMNAKVFLWSLLFVIPGLVAIYRYRQSWYLKSDHPDWSAAKCIAESTRMMQGKKLKAFMLDLSYIWWMVVAWGVLVGSALLGHAGSQSDSMLMSMVGCLAGIVGIYLFAFVIIYFLSGRTVFYRDLVAEDEQKQKVKE